MCFYQKSRQLPRSPPTHQQASILLARAMPCLHSKNRGSWGKKCLALSPRKEMGKRGLEWVWHDKSICHSPGSRVLEEATLRLFQCHLYTDWVSRCNSSYRHSLFFLLFYHTFLDSDTLPPSPIPYTTQSDHKPRHTTLQWNLRFQRSSSTDWPLGLWHRCLLDCRMFC